MRKGRTVPLRVKPTFGVVVDGECETWYLQMLKRNERELTVNIEPKIPQKKNITEQYETVVNLSRDYNKVFWIVDLDAVLKETRDARKGSKTPLQYFIEYQKAIKDYENIVLIINNPCIEFWLLLHFEETSKYFDNCEGAENQLKRYLKDYEKTKGYFTKQDNDIYLKLKPHLSRAIENAKKLKKFNIDEPYSGMTEMQLFFNAVGFNQN